jgi:hypothetical protein
MRWADRCLFELNPTEQHILKGTDGRRSAAQVATLLADAYDVPQKSAR